ncbi:MAG: EI24 domain-containing protein [Caldimonas sp.]
MITRPSPRPAGALVVDAFWRAGAYCLHPKVILASLLPLAIVGGAAALLGYFFWEPAVASVRATLDDWSLLDALFAWLRSIGGGGWASVIAPLVIVALALPVVVVASLLVAALLMTPAIVRLVAKRRFPALEARHGGTFWSGLAWSALSTLLATIALVVSIPFWLVPPLVLVLPPLIWGWLTYRVLAYDVLAVHASREERVRLIADERWALLVMGIVCGYLGAAPSLLWAMGALALVFAPFLILVSIWLYTLVFAFSSLWFAHYLLASLQRLRRDEGGVEPVASTSAGRLPGTPSDPGPSPWRSSLA